MRYAHLLPPAALLAIPTHAFNLSRRSPQTPLKSVPFNIIPPAFVDTLCTPGNTVRNPSFELGSQGPNGGPFGTLEGWRLYPLDSSATGTFFLEGNASFPDQLGGMGQNSMYPGNGYSLATNLTTSGSSVFPILGASQFIPICPDVSYTMYFYYAVTDRSSGAGAGAVTPAAGPMSSTAAGGSACKLYYGFSFNPLPPNFGSAATWMANQATAYPYFSSISSTSATPLGDTGFQFNLLQASINASTVGARNGTYIQAVIACQSGAPQSALIGNAWLSIYIDNFFLTSP